MEYHLEQGSTLSLLFREGGHFHRAGEAGDGETGHRHGHIRVCAVPFVDEGIQGDAVALDGHVLHFGVDETRSSVLGGGSNHERFDVELVLCCLPLTV